MKKWITGIVGIIVAAVLLVAGKQAYSYLYNENLIKEYEDGNYSVDTEPLFAGNWFESYIAPYNKANQHYQKGEYEAAMESYNQALEMEMPEEKECSVRINLALAMIYNMGEEYAAPENIETSIETLKEAREILLEEGCAGEEEDGHSDEAQKLKEEIDDLIEQLEQQQQQQQQPTSGEGEPEEQQENPEEQEEQEAREEEIKDYLQQTQQEAIEEREAAMEEYEEYNWDTDEYGIW